MAEDVDDGAQRALLLAALRLAGGVLPRSSLDRRLARERFSFSLFDELLEPCELLGVLAQVGLGSVANLSQVKHALPRSHA